MFVEILCPSAGEALERLLCPAQVPAVGVARADEGTHFDRENFLDAGLLRWRELEIWYHLTVQGSDADFSQLDFKAQFACESAIPASLRAVLGLANQRFTREIGSDRVARWQLPKSQALDKRTHNVARPISIALTETDDAPPDAIDNVV